MDLRKLKTLIDLVAESDIAELEVTEGESKVRIVKSSAIPQNQMVMMPSQGVQQFSAPAVSAPATGAAAPAAAEIDHRGVGLVLEGLVIVRDRAGIVLHPVARDATVHQRRREFFPLELAGFDDRAVKDAIFGEVVVRVAIFPIILGVEMGAGLLGVTDAMDQGEIAGVEDRSQEFERRMKRGKTIAGTDRFVITESGISRRSRRSDLR